MKLSIVTTLYNSSKYVYEFYNRVSEQAKKITSDYEIIFVDDGSPDDSLQKAIKIHKSDERVKIVELSRNYGHHKAIMTGLSFAEGDYTFLIDSDLEEEPELLGEFWHEIQEDSNLDVVYGVQESRKGGWFERWSGKFYYTIRGYLSTVYVPHNIITARLFNRDALDAVLAYGERELCMGSIFHDIGFNQKKMIVSKKNTSPSNYSLFRKVSLMFNSIVSFSSKPLVFILALGFMITCLSALYIIYILMSFIFFDIKLRGWVSVMVSIWFFGGLLSTFIGILGLYISKIFTEVKNRPYTLIRTTRGCKRH
ncbi:glycosyltransferase family 2 protein [Francisella sp. 19X1-34]|uniref:glycosyltransferase family 2 protein n=1 Tax=Francisella sp. 19X1-34 TaxID=3087177 RepID=UPI002E31D146|nr:glycosyltransferase family 2 protein [Francisella sp. 19X1-34]MED7787568.1 glycosyltransferase family 2 protein [Francisella sp. 19X1-34]